MNLVAGLGSAGQGKARQAFFDVTSTISTRRERLLMRILTALILTTALGAQTMTLDTVATTVGTPSVVSVTLTPDLPSTVVGWSYGVLHSAGQTMTGLSTPGSLAYDYFSTDIQVLGYTHAAVLSFSDTTLVSAGGVLTTATYSGPGAIVFALGGLGTPPVEDLVVGLAGSVLPATWVNGGVVENRLFLRGDCNGDSTRNLVDAIFQLNAMFLLGAPAVDCDDACDANDDGVMDLSDVVYELAYLYDGGLAMPAPFVTCGGDATADALGCALSAACP